MRGNLLTISCFFIVGLVTAESGAQLHFSEPEHIAEFLSKLDVSGEQYRDLKVAFQGLGSDSSAAHKQPRSNQSKGPVISTLNHDQGRSLVEYLRKSKRRKGPQAERVKPIIYRSNADQVGLTLAELQGLVKAAEYSADNTGLSYLVTIKGLLIIEHYPNGGSQDRALELASGTKSFSGVMALAAVQDGLLSLDEKVSDTITEWREHPVKRQITIRELLTLTSGIFGGQIGKAPDYSVAIDSSLIGLPGKKFSYGPNPFQIFGELMKRKLGSSPLDYLNTRILQPAGITYGDWKTTSEGDPRLPSGALFTAREWAQFGEFIRNKGEVNGIRIIDSKLFDSLEVGTSANPAYGLTWWLNEEVSPEIRDKTPLLKDGNYLGNADIPKDVFAALGAGGQGMFISRAKEMVVVRQAPISFGLRGRRMSKFQYDTFISTVFSGF